jgi:AcrR family transcriptional regulator
LSTESRQAEIVAAVIQLAAERAPAGITTAEIANALGLTQGALFKHFPTKDAIWLAAMNWVAEHLLAALENAAGAGATPLEGLQLAFMAHIRFVMRHPGVPRLIFNELQRPDDTPLKHRVRSMLGAYRKILARLLSEAAALGLTADGIDQKAAATLFIGTVQGLVMQSMLAGSVSRMKGEAGRVYALYQRAIAEKS